MRDVLRRILAELDGSTMMPQKAAVFAAIRIIKEELEAQPKFKHGDMVWIDGIYLGHYVGPSVHGWPRPMCYVTTFGTEFKQAFLIPENQLFREPASEEIRDLPRCGGEGI